jgi:uncharacterized membrane protein
MNGAGSDYGLWGLVAVNSVVFVGFAYSFFKPVTLRDWRSFGAYSAFIAIMFGFLLRWPTLLTLVMFAVLVPMYVRLAIAEERDSEKAFGDRWRAYAAATPRFIPHFGRDDRARPVNSH